MSKQIEPQLEEIAFILGAYPKGLYRGKSLKNYLLLLMIKPYKEDCLNFTEEIKFAKKVKKEPQNTFLLF